MKILIKNKYWNKYLHKYSFPILGDYLVLFSLLLGDGLRYLSLLDRSFSTPLPTYCLINICLHLCFISNKCFVVFVLFTNICCIISWYQSIVQPSQSQRNIYFLFIVGFVTTPPVPSHPQEIYLLPQSKLNTESV